MGQQEEEKVSSEERLIESVNNAGFFQLLDITFERVNGGIGKVRIVVDERLMHGQMSVHGGVIFTLADTAMSMALMSLLPPGTAFGTVEAKINFLLPVRAGELIAEGAVVHKGRSTAVLEATVYNVIEGERQAVARTLGTFSFARPK